MASFGGKANSISCRPLYSVQLRPSTGFNSYWFFLLYRHVQFGGIILPACSVLWKNIGTAEAIETLAGF